MQIHTLSIRVFAAACGVFVCASASAGVVYDVDLLSASSSPIVSFETARAGSDRYHRAPFVASPLQGGGQAATVRVREGDEGCRRDLRMRFADGRALVRRNFDVCSQLSDTAQHLRARREHTEAEDAS